MRRTLPRTAAVLLVGGMLLAGCGKAAKSSSPSPGGAPASVPAVVVTPSTAPAGSDGSVDNQLGDVDGLLSQIDGQVSADNQTPSDSD